RVVTVVVVVGVTRRAVRACVLVDKGAFCLEQPGRTAGTTDGRLPVPVPAPPLLHDRSKRPYHPAQIGHARLQPVDFVVLVAQLLLLVDASSSSSSFFFFAVVVLFFFFFTIVIFFPFLIFLSSTTTSSSSSSSSTTPIFPTTPIFLTTLIFLTIPIFLTTPTPPTNPTLTTPSPTLRPAPRPSHQPPLQRDDEAVPLREIALQSADACTFARSTGGGGRVVVEEEEEEEEEGKEGEGNGEESGGDVCATAAYPVATLAALDDVRAAPTFANDDSASSPAPPS
ncbi:hypothetical protein LTR28_000245, partial [Elasticomyces elasticus]